MASMICIGSVCFRLFSPSIVIAAMLSSAACSAPSGGEKPSGLNGDRAQESTHARPAVTNVDGIRDRTFRSIADLTAGADLVVVGRATADQTVEKIMTVPFTVTRIEPLQIWKADVTVPAGIKVRQAGGSGVVSDVPVVTSNRTYLLFLKRFTFGPGAETDQFVVVGAGAGLFSVTGNAAARLDPFSVELPVSADLEQIRREVIRNSH